MGQIHRVDSTTCIRVQKQAGERKINRAPTDCNLLLTFTHACTHTHACECASLIGLTCRAPIGARPRLILFGHIRPCTPHVRIHVCCSSTHARAHREIATLALTLQCMHGGCAYPGRTPQPCCHRYIARTASRNHTHTGFVPTSTITATTTSEAILSDLQHHPTKYY